MWSLALCSLPAPVRAAHQRPTPARAPARLLSRPAARVLRRRCVETEEAPLSLPDPGWEEGGAAAEGEGEGGSKVASIRLPGRRRQRMEFTCNLNIFVKHF